MAYTFEGFKRKDNKVGTRNYVGIVASVICSSAVVKEISDSVAGTIPVVHSNGCSQLGDDFKLTKNMLVGMTMNPNFHSSLLVGLGCETNQVGGMLKLIPKVKPVKAIGIQQLFGGTNTIKAGVDIVHEWTDEAEKSVRTTNDISELNIGILNVDLDEESYEKVSPVIGNLVDKLVDLNSNVIFGFSKTLEPVGETLNNRVTNIHEQKKILKYSNTLNRSQWIDPLNSNEVIDFTAEEKRIAELELGTLGSSSIHGLLDYGEEPSEKGLYLIKTSSNYVEALSKMASSGCNVAIIVSKRGVLSGSIALPCLTIGTSLKKGNFSDLVDYSITDNLVDEETENIIQHLLEVCSGRATNLEELELGDFSIPHLGTTF